MAIFHLSVKSVGRSAGRSALASSAYRTASLLRDERTGSVYNFTRKRGVEHTEIITPDRHGWSRQELWSAAESREKRKDARTAREYEIALPSELDADQRKALAVAFAELLADRYNIAVDVAVHGPGHDGDNRNHHAHLLCTTRQVSRTETGDLEFGEKATVELNDRDRAVLGLGTGINEIKEIREQWATLANDHLARAGREERIDHRSYKEQGLLDYPTTPHIGHAAAAMERRGIKTILGDLRRQVLEEQKNYNAGLGVSDSDND